MGNGFHWRAMVAMASVALIVALIGCSAQGSRSGQGAFSAVPQGQIVMLGIDKTGYTPHEFTGEAGKPVTLRNDGTIKGCASFVVQPELGIRADFTRSDSYTFTPAKKGRFTYTCSMGMYRGVVNVI